MLLYVLLISYINAGNSLQSANIFVIIGFFSLMTLPLILIPFASDETYRAIVSF